MRVVKSAHNPVLVAVCDATIGHIYLKDSIYYMCIEIGPNKKDMVMIGGNVYKGTVGRRTSNLESTLYITVIDAELHV